MHILGQMVRSRHPFPTWRSHRLRATRAPLNATRSFVPRLPAFLYLPYQTKDVPTTRVGGSWKRKNGSISSRKLPYDESVWGDCHRWGKERAARPQAGGAVPGLIPRGSLRCWLTLFWGLFSSGHSWLWWSSWGPPVWEQAAFPSVSGCCYDPNAQPIASCPDLPSAAPGAALPTAGRQFAHMTIRCVSPCHAVALISELMPFSYPALSYTRWFEKRLSMGGSLDSRSFHWNSQQPF